jgi:asparagine synthase (glutamine-hydrolysing)
VYLVCLLPSRDDIDGEVATRAAAARLPAGKVAQLKALANSQYYEFVFSSEEFANHIDPFNSQPVWEFVLSTPTYVLLNNGVSRGLARMAFRDQLPEEIRRRQTKGTGTPFYQHVVRQNLGLLREHLLEGHLVRQGYVSRTRLEHCLLAPEPFLIFPASGLLLYLAAEIWLQAWIGHRSEISPRLSAAVWSDTATEPAERATAHTALVWRRPDPHTTAART